ncbi:MAG: hypothetical protein P8J59_05865 [Phycisphaerales bacterium]|nr:hypothetical protein [Phycisphaerales bacterium]
MIFRVLMFGPEIRSVPRIFAGGLAVMISGLAFAVQDAPPAPTEPVTDPPVVEEPVAPSDPPSLDDLLEIEGESDSGAAESAAEAERQQSLDAALAEQEPDQAFRAAVTEMLQSVDRLRDQQATGLGTQRLQERIVDRLQVLIDSAKKQQQQQQSSSSSSQQQDPGRRSEGEPQDQQQQQGSQRNEGEAQDGTSNQPPEPDSADLEGVLDESRIEWGGLPPRVRDLITQGMRDQVSQLYRSLTEAYYRRMAEEAGE